MAERGIEGKYELLERLREGGMGAIYKVRHRLLDEVRVIKVLKPHLQGDPAIEARFLREARAAIRLRHPNIAQIFDFSVDEDGTAFLVMEFIDGVPLDQMIAARRLPPIGLAVDIARQALKALGYLHRQQFVHRDISPDNLMLTRDADGRPWVKLIDLGIAKPLQGEGALTETGLFMGKLRYASPERFESGGAADPRSDLYSLGIVLYELMTGCSPIAGDDVSSLIAGHIFRPPRSFSETDREGRVPEPVRVALLKAMAKRAEERFQTAESFARALAAVPLAAETVGELDEDLTISLTRKLPVEPVEPGSDPGSTQDRLNAQFRIEGSAAALAALSSSGSVAAAVVESSTAARRTTGRGAQLLALFAVAEKLLELGQLSEARLQVNALLGLDPENPDTRALAARIEQAEAQSRKVDAAQEEALRLAARQIATLIDSDDLLEAETRLYAAEQSHGERPELRDLAERLAASREAARAARLAALLASALRHEEAGDLEAAQRDLTAMRQLDPANEDARIACERIEAALRAAELERSRASALDETRAAIGEAVARGDLDQAREQLARALRTFGSCDPLEAATREVAEALAERERLRAEERRRQAIELLKEQAYDYLNSDRLDAALRKLREVQLLDAEDEEVTMLLADVERQVAELRRVLDSRTLLAQLDVRLGALLQSGDLVAARALLAEAGAQDRELPALADWERRLSEAERQAEEAEELAEIANLTPGERCARVDDLIEQAYRLLNAGRGEEARARLDEARRLDPDNSELAALLGATGSGEDGPIAES